MQGKTQAEVASLLDIHQGTVSRVIQRYERWLAHLKSRENGRLDPQERLRAQHQLTYDRNELILASCLRIARDTEGSLDSSRSTVSRPVGSYSQESEISTTHFTIDRTGTVCRFLRLAHRINMEQDKLAAQLATQDDPLPIPLSAEELAEQDRQAALDAAELATSQALNGSTARTKPRPAEQPTNSTSPPEPVVWDKVTPVTDCPHSPSDLNPEPRTLNPTPAHNTHNAIPQQIAANTAKPCTCVIQLDAEKISIARITDPDPALLSPCPLTPDPVPLVSPRQNIHHGSFSVPTMKEPTHVDSQVAARSE